MADRRVGLVLSRRPGERILIGPEIAVTIEGADNPDVGMTLVALPTPELQHHPDMLESRELDDQRLEMRFALSVDDRLDISEDISMLVVSVSGDSVRIGVDAPRSVQIYREEVYEEILEENRAAAEPAEIEAGEELDAIRKLSDRLEGDVEPDSG